MLKSLAAQLPDRWQAELKRMHFARQIRKNTFHADEPEYEILSQLVHEGDWVIDVGANVGHYTKRLSELTGPRGRVIAFEPVSATFSLLSANVQRFENANITLVNAAVSDKLSVAKMAIPKFSSGLDNYYRANLSPESDSKAGLDVLTLSVDSLAIDHPISLIKIDAEGHEKLVLSGMEELIKAFRPILIVETGSQDITDKLSAIGYKADIMKNSPNILYMPE